VRPAVLVVLLAWWFGGVSLACPESWWSPPAADEPLGRVSIALLAQTVEALEPAFPRTRTIASLALEPDDPLAPQLRYLRERGVVPPSFDPATFDAAVWQGLLDDLLASYGLPGVTVGAARTADDLRADLDAVIARVLAVIRPVALLAWEPDDEARLAFVGVVWNWSPYPRLLVRRPPEDWSMHDGAAALARRISVCGHQVRDFVSASAPVARSLFLSHAEEAAMYLVGSEPETRAWPYRVERGEEVSVFAFEHPQVRHVDSFSAVFAGPPLGPVQLARLLPMVRTNLSPVGLVRVLQTPPRRH
jgi:hypothetical protein